MSSQTPDGKEPDERAAGADRPEAVLMESERIEDLNQVLGYLNFS